MRGKPFRYLFSSVNDGSIPACAGEASAMMRSSRATRVYPRVCGGSAVAGTTTGGNQGLSPRVRGKRSEPGAADDEARSIPACAGEALDTITWVGAIRVYPRVCGGSRISIRGRAGRAGLSPRVRGKPIPICIRKAWSWSIPACAGEASRPPSRIARNKVYPRVCGGSTPTAPPFSANTGLSPRVRGKPGRGKLYTHDDRSIPACAGEAG